MSSAKSYKLSKIDVLIGDKKVDIRELVSEFNWFESIDSSFIRCDFAILDTVQFDDNLLGSEIVHLTFESTTEKKSRIVHTLQIYKIGSIVKQERAKMYILHCASPEIYENEANRAFGQFGPVSGKTDIVKRMIKDHLNSPKKTHIESHTNINVLSPTGDLLILFLTCLIRLVEQKQAVDRVVKVRNKVVSCSGRTKMDGTLNLWMDYVNRRVLQSTPMHKQT